MKNPRTRGQICVFLSALVFGFTPVLAAISYRGGNNGINMAFLRALLPLPVLLLLCRNTPAPTRLQIRVGLLAGLMLYGCTLMLYSSYQYISPGLATTLHFLYPVYVMLYQCIREKRAPGTARLIGLLLGIAGVLLFLDPSETGGDLRGYVLALLSGVMYAAYIAVLNREKQDPLPQYRLMVLVAASGSVLCAAAGLCLGKLTVDLTGIAWLCAALVALMVVLLGVMLFQRGVRQVGGTDAALFSLFEPITSVVFSVLLLGDALSLRKILGCALLLGGLVIISVAKGSEAGNENE